MTAGDDGPRGDVYRGPAARQHGDGNLQINVHEHRAGILAACAVALVCVATVIAVLVAGDPGTGAAGPASVTPTPTPAPATNPATDPAPGAGGGTDRSGLTGRLVNDGSGLCLTAPGTEDDVPVQDTCTGTPDRTWTLAAQDTAARTVRNARSGRCLAVAGTENFAPARQLDCAVRPDAQHWELLWGTGRHAGHFMLRSTRNAKCLAAPGAEPARPAVQTSCGEDYADKWWHIAAR
ncbi:ricin-type beta-trefoil lectin domain protein [Streptomyces roseirectus]|uniref:Ricin-type beta-trefoil lectin domain protein n=1 Tax=Streptomyces roseirectus TaxID=2768066 RepID=A0A7H0IN81_9ACTN|nr:RICIN domain-containing protein [Streptomyces roseirectus]QNP74247.1 ricin-type beta-trefoil lectin domain protein [Streptomyces roseirectus]